MSPCFRKRQQLFWGCLSKSLCAHISQKSVEKYILQAPDSDDSDPEFSLDKEADEESSEGESEVDGDDDSDGEGPSTGRIRPHRVRNDALWESKAMQEAEKMINAAEAKNKKEADVGESVLHQVSQFCAES